MLEARRLEVLAQPSAMKEVYAPADHYVNGHVILRAADGWHLFYHPMEPHPPSNRMLHATSPDLLTWTLHGPVVEAGGPGDCDAYEIGDCAIAEHEGRWYMVHQARPYRSGSRRFALAVSDDLYHWDKLPGDGSSIFTPHPSWSGWREQGVLECKGPFVFPHEGRYLMYYSSENRWGDSCIALATSKDMVHWEDEGPFITTHRTENPIQGPSGFECPRVVEHGGRYYMFVMHFWGLQYAVGDDPYHFGPWQVLGPWHAASIFSDGEGRWFITHAYRPFGKPSTMGRFREPHRDLYIGGLVWSDGVPVPVDLGDVIEAPSPVADAGRSEDD